MRDAAYAQLRELIVGGTLAPGERLRDREVAAWLGVSRTPVREAMAWLVDDGLVETAANRYTRVTDLRPADAADAYPILARLEGLAAAEAAMSISERDLRAIADAAERFTWALWRSDTDEGAAADVALHERLAEASANEPLRQLLARLTPRLRRLERRVWPMIATEWPGAPHADLLAALQDRSPTAAAEAMAAEWRSVGESVARALREAGYR
jgi:DNA-binding GntR family transcriptional regulator